MKKQQITKDLSALLRSRHTLLWVRSSEERRVEGALLEAAAGARMGIRYWDCAAGISGPEGLIDAVQDPLAALGAVTKTSGRILWVFRDLHLWKDPVTLRTIRNLGRDLQTRPPKDAAAVVILAHDAAEIPAELGELTVIDFPLPDREEIATILDDVIGSLPEDAREAVAPNGTREAAIDAAAGLSAEGAGNSYALSLITNNKRIDPQSVSKEKRRTITREKVLGWYEPDPRGLAAVGGYDLLKGWLVTRRSAFSKAARAYGLPAPKGVMLVGVPGCGKSLTAKAVASAWQVPLLRLDMGALRSKWVGDSEANIRKALSVAEAVAPCVLWLDEIEKALGGATGGAADGGATGGAADGGVSADALGTILSWMQEQASVFVVATANDVRSLPPELLRKGRFDELFFIDLPTKVERAEIITTALAQHGRGAAKVDVSMIADVTEGFTGAELAALVPDALYAAFADNAREIETEDLRVAAMGVVPLSRTAADKLDALRAWAQGRARPASLGEARGANRRQLDL